jgi:hypothetical protein
VPKQILKAYASKRHRYKADVGANVSCDDYAVNFVGLYPVRALPGFWTAGISYPTSWFDEPEVVPEVGAWVSYLETECNGCDPGVIEWKAHSDIPQALLESLRKEQPSAEGRRARDIAYALAVFGVEYEANRDSLLKRLDKCLGPGIGSVDDESCDEGLFNELENLYWRGDTSLLQPLLQVSDRDGDVVDLAGRFYADLLEARTEIALTGMEQLPLRKQRSVCERSVKDDLDLDPPKLARVEAKLQASGSDLALACLKTIQASAAQPR